MNHQHVLKRANGTLACSMENGVRLGGTSITGEHGRVSTANGQFNFLDLFAGGGGLSEGFIQAGFNPVAHVESDRSACFTLRTRMAYHWLKDHSDLGLYADYLKGSLSRQELYQNVPKRVVDSVINARIADDTLPTVFRSIDTLLENRKLDLVIGGPPCQAYSIAGRSRDQRKMKSDDRNYLYIDYAKFLERYQPSYFLFENVTGLLSATDQNGGRHFDEMRDLFSEHGYLTEYRILPANDYGVLQNRKRVFLVGRLGHSTGFYPEPDKWIPTATVNDVLSDLPARSAGAGDSGPCSVNSYSGTWQYEAGIRNDDLPVTWHQARPQSSQDLEIYRIAVELWDSEGSRLHYYNLPDRLKTHRTRDAFRDRFKVVASNLPFSHTVVAHIAKDGHYYIHPDIDQNRSITPREAARLQTFPDDYHFESISAAPKRTPAFRQIGNAAPVLLARKIAEKLKDVLA